MRVDATRARRTGAPDYDDPSFWDAKFATGQDVGEWLNPGEILLEALLSFLEKQTTPGKHATPRVLHLGPGVSKLGTRVRDAFVTRRWTGNGIVVGSLLGQRFDRSTDAVVSYQNVDFSSEAVRLGQDAENKQESSHAMRWMQTDLRSWSDVSRLLPHAPFEAILDKSTSDAISTSSPVTLDATSDMSTICPAVQDVLISGGEITMAPVELLALHLVPLTRSGSQWFVLSYSTMRFDNVPHLSAHWRIVARTPLEAPRGQTASGAYAPAVYHWLYILQRK